MFTFPALTLALLLLTPGQDPATLTGLRSGAEFPPQDAVIWMSERQGLVATLAARRLSEAPDAVETVQLLAQAKDVAGMLRALRLIVDTQPARIAAAFEAARDVLWQIRGDDEETRRNAETARQIVAAGRRRLPDLPREQAARAERVFIDTDATSAVDRADAGRRERLARFIEQYRGTDAALLAEVDAIADGRASWSMFEALDAFVRAHAGTTAAAKALYQQGFQWHTINTLGTIEPRGADPTDRFMRVLTIVNELESGRYPRSEWREKAPSLIVNFFMPRDANIASQNVGRLLEAYGEFARTHFALDEDWPSQSGIGYLLTAKMAELYERSGEGSRGVERTLANLERTVNEPAAVRYLRALLFIEPVRQHGPDHAVTERRASLAKARGELTALAAEGGQVYHRKALATLASLEFGEREYARARAAFRRYASSYPQSGWTWVALLRLGQCEEELGNPTAAVAAYLEAAATHADLPLARVLGHEYAARGYETAGELEQARSEHQLALAGWDDRFGLRYTTHVLRSPKPQDPFVRSTDVAEVTKEWLGARVAQLTRSLAMPGGHGVERGRSLLAEDRHQEAVEVLQRVAAEHPRTAAAAEARSLANRARLEIALQLADIESPNADERAAMKAFEELAREPQDFAVAAASIARAGILWKHGRAEEAEKAMTEALAGWHASQRASTPSSGLEQDVAEIRRVLFLPEGGEIYRSGRWNAFSFSDPAAPFALVNVDLRVHHHDGGVTRVSVVPRFQVTPKVLLADTEEIAILQTIMMKLGGTKRREPSQIMSTPNQPVGGSMEILQLWNRFFAARPGHWGGWDLLTYPVITEIHFTDAERTKAAAKVVIGYSGATVELEKQAGKWVPKRLTSQWVT